MAESRQESARPLVGERSWLVDVIVLPKTGVNDPEGEAIRDGALSLGYQAITRVRAGRFFQVTVTAESAERARALLERLCDQVLANPVIETYEVKVGELSGSGLSRDQT